MLTAGQSRNFTKPMWSNNRLYTFSSYYRPIGTTPSWIGCQAQSRHRCTLHTVPAQTCYPATHFFRHNWTEPSDYLQKPNIVTDTTDSYIGRPIPFLPAYRNRLSCNIQLFLSFSLLPVSTDCTPAIALHFRLVSPCEKLRVKPFFTAPKSISPTRRKDSFRIAASKR